MEAALEARKPPVATLVYGVVTIAVMLLVFAAFDDITTDNATAFPLEYRFLILSAAWLFIVSIRLLLQRQRVLGIISLVALGAALWGQQGIGQGIKPGLWPEYVATTAAFLWFCALSLVLVYQGWIALTRSLKQEVS